MRKLFLVPLLAIASLAPIGSASAIPHKPLPNLKAAYSVTCAHPERFIAAWHRVELGFRAVGDTRRANIAVFWQRVIRIVCAGPRPR